MNNTKIIIWTIVAIVLTILLICLLVSNARLGNIFSNESEHIVYEEEFDVTNIKNINLDWSSGRINIYKSESDKIKVIQKSKYELKEDELVNIDYKNETISVKEGKKKIEFFFLGFGSISTSLDVYLPDKEFEEVYVKISSGRANVENLNLNKFKVKVSSGKIEIRKVISQDIEANVSSGSIEMNDVKTSSLNYEVTSGKIEINNLNTNILKALVKSGKIDIDGSAKQIDLKATSGKILVDNNVLPESLDVKVTSGSIDVAIPENEGFEASYSVTSGSFKSDFDLYSNMSNLDKKNGEGKYKNGGNKFNFQVTSGKIRLEKK